MPSDQSSAPGSNGAPQSARRSSCQSSPLANAAATPFPSPSIASSRSIPAACAQSGQCIAALYAYPMMSQPFIVLTPVVVEHVAPAVPASQGQAELARRVEFLDLRAAPFPHSDLDHANLKFADHFAPFIPERVSREVSEFRCGQPEPIREEISGCFDGGRARRRVVPLNTNNNTGGADYYDVVMSSHLVLLSSLSGTSYLKYTARRG